MNIMIVGYGFVGKATELLLNKPGIELFIHDPAQGYDYSGNTRMDYIFLCVPTDLDPVTGKLKLDILAEVYEQWKDKGQLVIRSTIGPDQVPLFPEAIMMPEFLREKHWEADVTDPFLPIIASDLPFVDWLQDILPTKNCYFLRAKEAMMFKLARNSALAMKVAVANQFYEICQNNDMDYGTIEYMLIGDPNLGITHWQVPGHDGKLGFGGKCLPKDLTHMSTLCYNEDNILHKALEDNMMRRVLSWDTHEQ